MKSINKMAVVAALALSSAGVASATTYHVTGSTAFRVADVSAEVAYCNANGGAQATFYGSSLTGANYSVVQNPTATIKFENYFNGSVAGDEALVDGVTKINYPSATDFPPTTVGTLPTSTQVASGGTAKSAPNDNNSLSPYAVDNATADIAFSDCAFSTAQQVILASSDHTTATPTGDLQVGIAPFVFVANGSSDVYSKLTGLSMDPQKFTYAWSNGGAALSFFTGVNADEATTVYPLGRDVDSGTRATLLAESGYGLTGSGIITTAVGQWFPYNSTGAASTNSATAGVVGIDTTSIPNPTIAAFAPVPAETIDGYFMDVGDGGYYSGGNLAVGMSTAFASGVTHTVVMTLLGASDAKSALTATGTNRQVAVLMAYDGSKFDPTSTTAANLALITEGQYTFWSYEHLFYKGSATNLSTVASGLQTQMTGSNQIDELSSGGVTLGSMKVTRNGDGQNVQ